MSTFLTRPLRSLAYLLSSAPAAIVCAGVLVAGVTALPVGTAALSALERRRLRLVDPRPAPRRERAISWEVAYGLLLCLWLAPLDLLMGSLLLSLPLGLVIGPFYDLLDPASPYRTLGRDHLAAGIYISTVPQELMVVLMGVLLLVPAALIAVGLARVRGMVARLFLVGPADQAVADRLRASRSRMVDAFQAERRRIERDLHDGAQQRLTALIATLGLTDLELDGGPPAARAMVRKARDEALGTLAELRLLVQGIHPPVLTSHGLAAALEELAQRTPIPTDLDVRLGRRPPGTVESAAYFVAAEALANVTKHSRATRAWVSAREQEGRLRLEIGDDGVGGADLDAGSGLVGLSDRVSALDGTIAVASPRGGPTVLRVELPLR